MEGAQLLAILLNFCKAPAISLERGPQKHCCQDPARLVGYPLMGELYRPGVLRWGSCTALVCCDGHQQVAGAPEVLSRSLPLTKGNTTSYYKAAADVTE